MTEDEFGDVILMPFWMQGRANPRRKMTKTERIRLAASVSGLILYMEILLVSIAGITLAADRYGLLAIPIDAVIMVTMILSMSWLFDVHNGIVEALRRRRRA